MSLKNVVKRRAHKERSQPSNRARYGLLEKKKDYKLRALDYHRKEEKIKKLKQAAAMRNPDEFYFKMIRSTTTDGTDHLSYRPPEDISEEELKVLRTQDIGYLFTALQKEKKEIERLEALLSVQQVSEMSNKRKGNEERISKHTVFVDDEEELETFSTSEYFDTPDELIERKHNRLTKSQLQEPIIIAGQHLLGLDENDSEEGTTKAQRKAFRKLQKLQRKNYQELNERKQRYKRINSLIQEKQLEKNLASKGEKVRVNDGSDDEDERPIYKWKPIRKR